VTARALQSFGGGHHVADGVLKIRQTPRRGEWLNQNIEHQNKA
jgi:hypothetical protein